MRTIIKTTTTLMVAALCTPLEATDYTWTGGAAPDRSWSNPDNWDLQAGYPDDDTDTATIPYLETGHYPELTDASITIKSLAVKRHTDPEIEAGADVLIKNGLRLTIKAGNGLTVEEFASLRLQYECRLELEGGGTIALDGTIEGEQSLTAVDLLGGHTYVTTGNGVFLGSGSLTLNQAGPSGPDTLVLGPGNAIYGTVKIRIALVNNGLVNPNDPISVNNVDNTITLTCDPKVGAGDWQVTCDACDSEQEKNTMIIETPVVGSGDLLVGHHGLLQVNRPLSLHGKFQISGLHARIEVKTGVVFDVDRFACQFCPPE